MSLMKVALRRVSLGLLFAAAATASLAQTPQKGGSFIYGVSAEAGTLDCGGTDTFAVLHMAAPFYSLLVKVDLANYPKVTGDLAKSWKISEDGKTYTFELHPDVKFHDGSPFTSADVKATYERYRNPPDGVPSFRKANFADIESIEAPSATTVVFKLKAPNPAMLLNLASPHGCVYSAAKLAQDPKFPATHVMGTGPFKFVEYVKGSHITGARFEGYFRKNQPYLDGTKAVFFTQPAAMTNAIQGGQILGEFRTISPTDKERLKSAMGDKIKFYESGWSTVLILAFNTSKKPFDDVRVRQALTMTIDRWGGGKGLSKTTNIREVGGLIRPGAPYAADKKTLESLPGYATNMEAARKEAKRLLKEAGAENLKFTLFNRSTPQPYTPTGIFLLDQWRKIGVEVEHKQVETAPYREGIKTGSYDVAVDFINAVLEDPALTLTKYISSDKSSDNGTRSIDRDLDGLFEKITRETDQKKREELVRAFEKRAITQAYQVPLIWWYRTVAVSSRVKGWQMSPSHTFGQDLADVWLTPAK